MRGTSPRGSERSLVSIALLGQGDCVVELAGIGVRLGTSKPRVFGGSGTAFSSTDLLAAALGTCIATDLEPIAVRHGIPVADIRVEVEKVLATRPKRVDALHVLVRLPLGMADDVVRRFERAANHCVVHRSLDPGIDVAIEVSPGRAV